VIGQCDRMGYTGEVWPVHPRHEQIAGRRCYRSVAQLPSAPDAAFIGVNRYQTIEIIRQLSAAGGGGAVCYASGFLEATQESSDGERVQAALLEAAGNMPILGPNCYGLINYLDGALLWPDQHGGQRLAAQSRGVAIIGQSSNILINLTMQQRGLPIAYVLAAGNQAQLSLAQIALALLDDPRVSAIGLHIEGLGDVSDFEILASRARAAKVPIIALKVGRSHQAQAATLSHTASLAGSDAGAQAFLQRLGIARVESLPVFLECLKLLHVQGPLAGYDIASMSCSGGEACLMADAVLGTRLRYRPLSSKVRREIKSAVGELVTVANPLDYHTFIWNNAEALCCTFTAMLAANADLTLLVLDFPRPDCCDDQAWWTPVEAFAKALQVSGRKGAVVSSLPENISEGVARRLLAYGIVPLLGISEAMLAIQGAVQVGDAWREDAPLPVVSTGADTMVSTQRVLDEDKAKSLLAIFGIPVPPRVKAFTISAAVRAADSVGYPVVLKALGIAHKTEAGAVRVGLGNAAATRRAARELLPMGKGLLVESLVSDVVAELILGVHRDPQFGLVLSLGAGGIFTELLRDSVQLLMPVTAVDIRRALSQLQVSAVLNGYRGGPPADMEALVEGVLALPRLCKAQGDRIIELDINPFMVRSVGKGAVAVDALIKIDSNVPQ